MNAPFSLLELRPSDGPAATVGPIEPQPLGRFHAALLAAVTVALGCSAIRPHDYFTWLLEVAPILIVLPILTATFRRFPLTRLCYILIAIHCVILMIGGHYTYALVPAFDWLKNALHLSRNHYDRLGHLAQGFVPSLVVREFLLRKTLLRRGPMLFFLVVCVGLAISATYELVEWWTSLATGEAGDAFLGTQGDPWDTQADMLMALIGAVLGQLTLARRQDRELATMTRD